MENMMVVCTPDYPMSGGAVARTVSEAFLVKASRGVDVPAVKPVQRERITAAAGIVLPPVQVQVHTTDPSVSSALTRERGT